MKRLINYFLLASFTILILSCEKKENVEKDEDVVSIPSNIKLGDFFAGGYVFYLKPDKSGGLVFAPSDVTPNPVAWGCKGLKLPILGTKAGDGLNNTKTILSLCSETNIAAKLCDLFASAGYNDWFLPSEDELQLIASVCYEANSNVNADHKLNPLDFYWTSTESHDYMARVNMGKGQLATGKFRDDKHRVRAARAF
ncbi:MAG: hypothetical protein B7X86_03240 [Sphingobacteriales bacterium 17-39-43]|nr:MAG: hypothetical protein B7Y24_03240 [Sphingobacteriales bacterium 16-39-50]OZA26754.1 MAG: hypothetical protein B7X86_03240 [Sphingobacteriales bacterium 17-39-43]